jgi:ATP-dependent exoDNAse (exonuclease V) beta subunit
MNDLAAARAARAADASARDGALDVARSFLVQAPAGSGKTELLIQRFLALLARVDRPERIVAMTFTRKAAGEMRERIVSALRDAEAGSPVTSPHGTTTRALARAALEQDARHGWHLIAHPARLGVQTIDALCAGFARQAPLATGLGAAPRFEERAHALYVGAVREALADAPASDPQWQRLLAHLDNDARATVTLLAGMLGQRDQWLRELVHEDRAGFRAGIEATLAAEIRGALATLAALFTPAPVAEIARLARYAGSQLDQGARAADLAQGLAACAAAGGLPPATVEGQDAWRALAAWLLVANAPRFRVKLDRNDGFPAKGSGPGAAERAQHNAEMKSLIAELAARPGLADALDAVRRLPPPAYTDSAWDIVSALLDLLPRLVAHLELIFGDAGAVDFTQVTLAALKALGPADAPSDLLLKLDYRIEHLLIDEFQDTSFVQLDLIERLTAGWQQGDGRTLFAVGDPMQSVYRFREAEVRIIVEAQQRGRVGDVPVENLVLTRNFRSQAGLVLWVNRVFARVLGSQGDPWRGAVAFSPSTSDAPTVPGEAVTVEMHADAAAEVQCVVGHIRSALAAGMRGVAVLVRARAHLDRLLPALRSAGIEFAAVELDALAERQAVLDLVSLTHALVQPFDRLAWLAVLRAPWSGLALSDLFAVAAAADAHPTGSIAALVDAPEAVAGLSVDGATRFERIAECLRPALAARGRTTLARRVRGAWLALGGAAALDDAIDLDAAVRFWELLSAHEIAGDIPDWAAFVDALGELRLAPSAGISARVQVMTLHRAKGLEFDAVIMPGLGRAPRRGDPGVLRWRSRPQGLLLAPGRARGGDFDPIYTYLGYLAADEERAELARLLYVGCTRAKTRLHLTGTLAVRADDDGALAWKPPAAASALARLWSALPNPIDPPRTGGRDATPFAVASRPLVRFQTGWTVPVPEPGVAVLPTAELRRESLPFDWARETARHVGVVAHRYLARIARDGLATWNEARIAASSARIRTDLAGEGVDASDLERAASSVADALRGAIDDERGRWLLAPDHAEPASEWPLSGVEGDTVAHLVLDRTFVADGARWIVDFKTGAHEGGDVDAFLDREVERYRDQLERYARLVAALDPRPIRLGLYHPLLRGWREWAYSA